MAWYKTGSVTINTGETNVVGNGTRFVSNCRVGDGFRGPDGEWYELVNTASETSIGIFPPYAGPSVVDNTDYMVAPIQGYNKETADRLRYITDNIRDFSEDVEAARQSAEEAKASQDAAKVSETNAKTSENNANASEVAAKTSEDNAKQSETNASQSQQAASISETNAKKSETNASISENNAKASEVAAADSAEQARLSALAASVSQSAAKSSEDAAKVSETNSKGSETSAASDAATATNGATTATNSKVAAEAAQKAAEKARDDAIAAAGTVTGQLQDMGPWDASTGVYPARPVFSAFWKVTGNGSATDKGVTTEYGIGDTLMYTKTPLDEFYKIDNTEAVSSVAGKTGVVLLDKSDVGLPNVDDTSDIDKPVSTAVKTELDKRTPTVGRQDTTAGRIVKVGDYGANGGTPIPMVVTDDANAITVGGYYLFDAGGVNTPENGTARVYLHHIPHTNTNNAKQFAYSVLGGNRQFVRTRDSGTWTPWKPIGDIIDSLTSTSVEASLSANQGKVLFDMLQANNATIVVYNYKPVAGTIVISGVDTSGKSLTYVPGNNLIVTLNGFYLQQGVDFTATTGNSISLTRALEDNGEITITVFGSFLVANTYTKAETDTKIQQVTTQVTGIDNRLISAENKQNIYAYAHIARDQINPGNGDIIAWSVDVDKMFRKGINYTIGSRAFTIMTAGLYEMEFNSLTYSVSGGACDVSMITTTPASVTRQRRAYTFTPAGQNVNFTGHWVLRLGVGDSVYVNITRGNLFNPDATDANAFTSFSLKRIDD